MEQLEREIKQRLEDSAKHTDGEIERMRERIDKLESAVAHLMAFIADRLRLTPEEIENENGLTDF